MIYIEQSEIFGCTCTDYVDRKGFGNCQRKSMSKGQYPFAGKVSCYVNLPSSCPDLISSRVNDREYPDKKISAEACRDDPNTAGSKQ